MADVVPRIDLTPRFLFTLTTNPVGRTGGILLLVSALNTDKNGHFTPRTRNHM